MDCFPTGVYGCFNGCSGMLFPTNYMLGYTINCTSINTNNINNEETNILQSKINKLTKEIEFLEKENRQLNYSLSEANSVIKMLENRIKNYYE